MPNSMRRLPFSRSRPYLTSPMTVFTIGHSTRSIEDFIAALQARRRRACSPISAAFPNRAAIRISMARIWRRRWPRVGIGYRHFPALGGRRGKRADGQVSPNTLWRQEPLPQLCRLCRDAGIPRRLRSACRADARPHRRDHVRRGGVVAVPPPHRRRLPARRRVSGRAHLRRPASASPRTLTPGAQPRGDGTILYEGRAAPAALTAPRRLGCGGALGAAAGDLLALRERIAQRLIGLAGHLDEGAQERIGARQLEQRLLLAAFGAAGDRDRRVSAASAAVRPSGDAGAGDVFDDALTLGADRHRCGSSCDRACGCWRSR